MSILCFLEILVSDLQKENVSKKISIN